MWCHGAKLYFHGWLDLLEIELSSDPEKDWTALAGRWCYFTISLIQPQSHSHTHPSCKVSIWLDLTIYRIHMTGTSTNPKKLNVKNNWFAFLIVLKLKTCLIMSFWQLNFTSEVYPYFVFNFRLSLVFFKPFRVTSLESFRTLKLYRFD